MKPLTAEAVEPLSIFTFSTVLSTARVVNSFAFSGTELDDFAISVTSPIFRDLTIALSGGGCFYVVGMVGEVTIDYRADFFGSTESELAVIR